MADQLQLVLLGSPQVQLNSTPVTGFITSKAEALFYYLAATGRVHKRITLAGLLWPDAPDVVARKNLRDIISNLRKLLGSHLLITRQTMAFDVTQPYWLDSAQISKAAQSTLAQYDAAQLQAAVDLYHGDFLAGFYVRDADPFEEWVLQEREQLRTAVLHIMHLLTAHYVDTADWNNGLQISQRLLAMEPWDEAAHRQQMRLLAGSGQRGAALAQFEQCKVILAAEFAVEPADETRELYQFIRDGKMDVPQIAPLVVQRAVRAPEITAAAQNTVITLKREIETLPRPVPFVGRQEELEALWTAVINHGKRIVSVVGLGGQGKTALVAQFATTVAQQLEKSPAIAAQPQTIAPIAAGVQHILWYGCQNAPTLREILIYWLQQLSEQSAHLTTATTERLQQILLKYLQHTKCLLVLDNFESFLGTEAGAGGYCREHKEIQLFLDWFTTTSHRSSLILTSREQPLNLIHLNDQSVFTLHLHGMAEDDAIDLLQVCQVNGRRADLLELIRRYSGHPLALKIMAEAVREIFTGNLVSFLQEETLFFDDIRNLLAQQFARLSPLELEIIFWLAIARDVVTPQHIWDSLLESPPRNRFFEAIRSLQRRALIETEERPKRFNRQISLHLTLPAVVLEYARTYLIDEICRELNQGEFEFLQRYALVRAQDPDYIQQIQIRFLLHPIAQQISAQWGSRQVEERLDQLIIRLRQQRNRAGGYAAANLIHLMQHLQISLRDKDFSGLAIHQADFRRAQLTRTNLSNTNLTGSAFAGYFGAVLAVAFSPDNQLLATATTDGDIQLWRTSDGQLAGVCHGNGRWIWTIAFHPNGQLLVSGSADRQVRIWDIGDFYLVRPAMPSAGVPIRTLQGHTNAIFSVTYSPDGHLLASGSADGTIRLWRAGDGTLVNVLTGHSAAVFAVAFDPSCVEGSRLVSGSRDGSAHLWDTTTGQVLRTFTGHTDEILSLAIQPNGQQLVTAAWDQTVRVWSLATGAVITTFADAQGALLTVAWHTDNDTIAAAGNDHVIYLWSLSSGTLKSTLQGHFGAVGTLAFANDGCTLASGSFDQTIRLWDSTRGHALRIYHGQRNAIRPLSLSADGRWLVNGNVNQRVCAWNVGREAFLLASASGDPHHIFQEHAGDILCVCFHPKENRFASAGQDGTIRLWSIEPEPTLVHEYHQHNSVVLSLAFSPNGRWLASGDTNRAICLRDLQADRCIYLTESAAKLVETLVFTPDSNYLLSGCDDGKINIFPLASYYSYSFASNEQLAPMQSPLFQHLSSAVRADSSARADLRDGTAPLSSALAIQTATNGVNVLAVSPAGGYLAVGGAEPHIELWRIPEPTQPVTPRHDVPDRVLSSLEALRYASESRGSTMNGHQISAGNGTFGALASTTPHLFQLVQTLPVVTSTFALAFAPNGKLLIGAGGDHTIYVWDLAKNQQIAALTGHTGTVFTLQFSPNGERFYSSSADETIRVWERSGEEWICVAVLHPPGLYRGLNIFGASGINAENRSALRALGAIEQSRSHVAVTIPHNLPSSLTSLYGRDDEIALLQAKLAQPDTRLLTIWGEGGVGKTRLAMELARTYRSVASPYVVETSAPRATAQFVDGVWFVPLAHIAAAANRSEQLAAAIGNVLNVTFGQGESLSQQLFARLQTKQLLLLLDNFEHLTAATDFLVQLLQAAPGIKLIVTSRHRLHLVAQTAYRLQGLIVPTQDEALGVPDATLLTYAGVRLFVDRVERVMGNFTISPQNRDQVLTLCRLVNGLPLGIELVANQLYDKGLAEVVQTVTADLTLLQSDAYDLPKEQQSLHAVFRQSWQNLSPALQRVLVCCGIFQGGFTREAAQTVTKATRAQVQALCDRALLYEQSNNRYGMHGFICSLAKQEAGESIDCTQVRTDHAVYYLQMLQKRGKRSTSTAEDFQALSAERDNIRVAWQWMVEKIAQLCNDSPVELLHSLQQLQQGLEGFFYLQERFGNHQEIEEVATQTISVIRQERQRWHERDVYPAPHTHSNGQTAQPLPHTATTVPPHQTDAVALILQELLTELLIHYATYQERIGAVENAACTLTEAIGLAQEVQAYHLEAHAYYLLATQHQQAGKFAEARTLLMQVETLAHSHHLTRWRVAVHNLRGILHDMQGNPEPAMAQYALALPLAIADGDLYQERLLVNNMGLVALNTGHWEEARQYLRRNLDLSKTLGDPTRQTFALMNHALLLDTLGLYTEAEQDLQKALEIARDIRHRQAEVYVLQFLALVGFHTGNSTSARQQAEESLVLIERHGLLSMKAQGLTVLGHNLLSLGEKELALETYSKAIGLWRAMDNQIEIYTARAGYAFAAIQSGKTEEAIQVVNQLMDVMDRLLEHHSTGTTWMIAGCYYILQIANDGRAHEILQKGYGYLQQQAAQLSDRELRNSFLNNVFSNRTIIRLVQGAHSAAGEVR
ncbi:MAG: AAA family ATPase [Caldilineaceae bacterium]|nr:AAA family ATPase [Caldilineaceae bacterium]